jgi:hypothetical protein
MLRRPSAFLGLPLLLSVFFSVPSYGSSTVILTTGKTALAGSAYSSVKQDFIGAQCVSGNSVPTGASDSSLSLDQTIDETKLSSQLGFGLGTRARFGVTQASLSAEFLTRSISNAYSVSSIYSAHYNLAPEKIVSNSLVLTSVGTAVSGAAHFDRWTETCGDSFVDEVRKGGELFISIRVDFFSKQDQQEFSSKFSISGPIGEASAHLEQASSSYGQHAKVIISAYQIGGDVTHLSGIFGSPDGIHTYTECSLGKFESCAQVLQSAIAYAADLKTGFPSQLSADQKPGPSVLAYGVSTYKSYGIYPHDPPGLASAVELARDELSKQFETSYRQALTADRLLATSLNAHKRSNVEAARDSIKRNLATEIKVSDVCYNDATNCIQAVDSMSLLNVRSDTLFPDSFSTLCADSLSSPPSDPIKATVATLISLVDPHGEPANELDCRIYERFLNRLSVIDISDHSISDISPFSSFGNLESLRISDNSISDIRPLGDLVNLGHLFADNNKIIDLSPLSRLVFLERLSLDQNRISNISALSGLPVLSELSLSNNQISDISPLSQLVRLEMVGLDGNNIMSLQPMKQFFRLQCINLQHNLIPDSEYESFRQRYPKTIVVMKSGTAKVFSTIGPYCEGPVIEK